MLGVNFRWAAACLGFLFVAAGCSGAGQNPNLFGQGGDGENGATVGPVTGAQSSVTAGAGAGTPATTSASGVTTTSSSVSGGTSVSGAGGAGASQSGVSSASAGSGGVAVVLPTPPQPGVNYPFPQSRQYANCTYPAFDNAAVQAAYKVWKDTLITADGAKGFRRVQRTATEGLPGHTVSEGIGYGMILAVYMNDQALFDDLWRYEQQFLDVMGKLMNWDIDATGAVSGTGAATDADEDMAWALLMADRQWGGQGALSDTYLNIAKGQIAAIWSQEIFDSKLPKLGDTWGDWNSLNISYFAPAYYRAFAAVDANDWASAIKTVYDTIDGNLIAANKNQTNGLVPGFSTSVGTIMMTPTITEPFTYQYDACRTPFRIGLDWCMNGEPRAKAYVAKTSSFFSGIGASKMVDGYNLDGTPTGTGEASPFVGPAAVGAMSDAAYQPFLAQAYTDLATKNLLVGGTYYAESWTTMSLLMLSGNFLDYTQIK